MLRRLLFGAVLAVAPFAAASETLDLTGFALARAGAASTESAPFEDDGFSGQVQIGIDWRPSLQVGAHLHLMARDEDNGSRRGNVGIVEAYLEGKFRLREDDLVRVLAGAFFLPTSRENVDGLWESPYTITSSALNSWMGEEFRPVGLDVAYTMRQRWTAGATIFIGNDTFGGLPIDRGWTLSDDWIFLGEHAPVIPEQDYSSVSAETDDRIGWSARGRWRGEHALIQATYIDNRSDGRRHGELLNWDTRMTILGGEYSRGEWTTAAETTWGPSTVRFEGGSYTEDLAASYILLSRRISRLRATLRHDWFTVDEDHATALTAAVLWSPRGPWRPGVELTYSEGETRFLIEARYYF